MPLDWAMTQNNLGSALQRIGEREGGTDRLEDAAAAYNDALVGLHRRQRDPLPPGLLGKPRPRPGADRAATR